MTNRNNYDQSSTGINIEASCFYDTDSASMNFRENFEILQYGNYRKSTVAYYTDYGNVKSADDISFSIKGDKSEKVRFLLDYVTFEKEEIETWDDDTIYDEIVGQHGEKISLLNMDDFNKYMLKDFNLELVPNKNIQKLVTRGYSQGDYAEVYYCPDELAQAWGNDPKENELQKTFGHLFWDAPIYARIEINEEEYIYYDCPAYDEYDFKRDDFLKYVSEKSGVSIEALDAIMPNDPSY